MLAFVFNAHQWRALRNDERDACAISRVATLDADVIACCRRLGIESADLSDGLLDECMRANQLRAASWCDRLGDSLSARLLPEHRMLGRHMAHDLLYPFGYVLHLRSMILRLLEDRPAENVAVFRERDLAFFWDPPDVPPDIANTVAARCAETVGARIRWLTAPAREPPLNTPADRQHIWNPASRIPNATGTRIALLQGIGWGEAQEAIAPARSPDPNKAVHALSQAWLYYGEFAVPYSEAQMFATVRDAVRELGESDPAFFDALGGAAFDFLWRAWAGRITACVRKYAWGRWVASSLKPTCVIMGYDIQGPERAIAQGITDGGAIPISILHGGINGMENEGPRHRGAFAHLAVWSARDIELLKNFRSENSEIEAVGSLRGDIRRMAESAIRDRKRPRLHADTRPRIVFLTCRVGGLFAFTASFARHVETWRALQEMSARRTEWVFVLKRHPRYDHDALYGLDGAKPVSGIREAIGPLETVLEEADIVVLPNVETTAALESMWLGIPTVYLDAAAREPADTWMRRSGIPIVHDVPSLESLLERIVRDGQYRKELGRAAQQSVRDALPRMGTEAADLFFSFIDRLEKKYGRRDAIGAINAGARWFFEMARWIDEIMLHDPRAAAPRSPSWSALRSVEPEVNWPYFGQQVVHRIVWHQWGRRAGLLSTSLWRAWRAMPRMVRPPVRVIRTYMLEALRRDAADPTTSNARRRRCRALMGLLSPHSLFTRNFERIDTRS